MKSASMIMGVCILLGCSAPAPEPEEEAVLALDWGVFQQSIEPMLQQRCANPSCHGRPERPWSIYAPGRFRLDSTRLFIDEDLNAQEKEHNFWVSSVFANIGGIASNERLLLQKPLAQGVYHGGGAIFLGERDEAARTLRAWIEAGSAHAKDSAP